MPETRHNLRPPRRAQIVNVYSARNVGDAAITLATVRLLNEFTPTEVTIATRHWKRDRLFYDSRSIAAGPPLIPFPLSCRLGEPGRLVTVAIGTFAAFLIILVSRLSRRFAVAIADHARLRGVASMLRSDVIVLAGGGYLYSSRRRSSITVCYAMLTTRLAVLSGKPVVMMPQSIGPFRWSWDSQVVRWGLSPLKNIVVREEISNALATELLSDSRNVKLSPDIAFLGVGNNTRKCTSGRSTPPVVSIVVMDWTWARTGSANQLLQKYIHKIADVAVRLSDQGLQVELVGHSSVGEQNQDDFLTAQRIADRVAALDSHASARVATEVRSPEQVAEYFASKSVVIGTRMHSCILSLTVGTPAIALSYQPKTLGTYEMLGLHDWVHDVETFEPNILADQCVELIESIDKAESRTSTAIDNSVNTIHYVYAHLAKTLCHP